MNACVTEAFSPQVIKLKIISKNSKEFSVITSGVHVDPNLTAITRSCAGIIKLPYNHTRRKI